MPRVRVSWRDDEAPHQIRVFSLKGSHKIHVSCTCRQEERFGNLAYEPMGVVPPGESAFKLFDDPDNHVVNKGVEFNPGDRVKQEMFYVE